MARKQKKNQNDRFTTQQSAGREGRLHLSAARMSKSTANLKQFADLEGKYEILKQLGEGAYGVVAAAKDKESNEKVAIKRIKDAVEDKEQVDC